MANTIDSNLQLTEVLDVAMRALERTLTPLLGFSTVFSDVALKGDDTMAIPYYPLTSTGTSQTRAVGGSYKALATSTTTSAKTLTNWTNQVQALSFNGHEVSRQPRFDPVMHGRLKGEALAYDVLADIFKVIKHSNFTTTPVSSSAGNFDEDDVADLQATLDEAYWPQAGRGMVLNPRYAANLLKQAQIVDASARGDGGAAFRDGRPGRVLGFDVFSSAGLLPNNGTAFSVLGEADNETFTAAAHGLVVGDRVIFPVLNGGTGLTAATKEYFVKTVPDANTFTVAETAGGSTAAFSADVTSGSTCQKYENVKGVVMLPSAILVGFAPVRPTDGVRQKLVDYQEMRGDTGLVLQYKRLAYEDTDEEAQVIECHYASAIGDAAQLQIITGALS